ncbi:MAG: IncW-like replication protein [uncultured Paraburkholderia sp.]|nr:MAG: IncW-like replication protein [uncultured Paraburkholderia sp.]CAH2811239.1 MAG: IncW-like replication protein [uncultured Paraburkholderia sp.]CAH2942361.1 MAG: IncW-like replication protein [uncultured Paraburkholderia sp.]CAH2946148.1 MAG: IncW-like replication protein [uncultured Paraburkholderia sp.]
MGAKAALENVLTDEQITAWRDGYRLHLVAKGVPTDTAAELAQRTAYRSDLYPTTATGIIVPPESKPARKVSARTERLVKTAAEIASERPDDEDRAYMHSILCQVGLPRSKVDGTSFERRSGGAALLVEAGKLWDGREFVQQEIPYGPMPRLILTWMNTYAVRNNSPEIPVGESASEFLRLLGQKSITGGKTGSFTTFRKQLQALSACRMILGFNANGHAHTYDGKPIKHFDAWISKDERQRPLWPGIVTFSSDYYDTLKEHAVPIDLRAFMELKGSALDLDIYTWLAQRLHRIEGRPVVLYWSNLRDQFGQEYRGKEADKDFKKKFLPSLKRVLAVYPEAKVKQVTGGIMMMASPPPIPYKGS